MTNSVAAARSCSRSKIENLNFLSCNSDLKAIYISVNPNTTGLILRDILTSLGDACF